MGGLSKTAWHFLIITKCYFTDLWVFLDSSNVPPIVFLEGVVMLKGFRGSNLYIRRIARRYVRKLSDSEEISNITRNTVHVIWERSSGITGREYTTTPKKSRISRGLLSTLYARNLTDYQKEKILQLRRSPNISRITVHAICGKSHGIIKRRIYYVSLWYFLVFGLF